MIGFFAMVVGMFLAILDIQIVASSLTEIQAGLSASADEISWIQTSYLIAEVIMIPLSGFLSRLLSTRILFVASVIGFTIMSLGCAFAESIEAMIIFRTLQGFLGGAMIPLVFASCYLIFPPERRTGITVIIGLVATMAPTLGPSLGGYLTQTLSWHWLFLINVVPGLIIAGVVWRVLHIDQPNRSLLQGFDFIGLVLMALFLGSLQFVLEEGPRKDWFEDTTIVQFSILSALTAVLFISRAMSYANPIVELRAFADRNFIISSLYGFIIGVGLYGSVYMMPLFLARVRGFNSLQIGMIMIVTGVFQFLSAPVAGALSRKLDLRIVLALGLGLFAIGSYYNAQLTADASFWELFVPQAFRGFSIMLCFIPINTLALGTLPPDKLQDASGLYNLMRNLGGAIGIAILNTLMTDRAALHWTRLIENISASSPQVQEFVLTLTSRLEPVLSDDANLAALELLQRLIRRETMVLTFNDGFMAMSCAFAVALLLMPLVRKPQNTGAGGH